jgi:hypothetical protein
MVTNLGNDSDRTQFSAVGAGPARVGGDEMFCTSCGRVIPRDAAICVGCGVATRRGATGASGFASKSKTTSVLLAIFFGVFTWLYTYREDASKFWITIGITVINFILTLFTFGIWALVAFPVSIGFWIWTIVDTTTKSDEWYGCY